jgi:catechol 2,3-dioxygenase-like lactoylglutathione lyase family enzyme
MIDHVSLGSHRFEEAIRFFTDCLLPLGFELQRHTPQEAAFGTAKKWDFWLYPASAGDAIVGARSHVAINADTREKVLRFHSAAARCGAASVREPGPRPDISPDYFGTVIRDLDGHTIEAVHWSIE